ncbi:alpha/beta hydrolase [Nocardia sp. BSTN01]|uniref:alpha/beta fold hydrolase n=1 Tax=Nocardia sp. BSTN01 TaxID=2783665 RepID=UPI00188ECAA6|nr:alpha/beta hydrolase [Nocardia sp. BSTN01]MBF4996997.1 alpha/beta hydrolase [Nocardia sp. BSTN01]
MSVDSELRMFEKGSGPMVLVLHGGGGPATVAGLAEHLAGRAHVLAPTHPGWDGTSRPRDVTSIGALAELYLGMLAARGVREVVVVGSSIGGWIAAEMSVRDREGLVGGVVLINATGIRVESEPIVDFFALDAREVAEYSYHDPGRFYQDPALVPAEQLAARRVNMAVLQLIAQDMCDPGLASRLGGVDIPALLIWGESDRIVTPAYGAAYADAFGNARLEIIGAAGHLPHLEQPEATFAVIDTFLDAAPTGRQTPEAGATAGFDRCGSTR